MPIHCQPYSAFLDMKVKEEFTKSVVAHTKGTAKCLYYGGVHITEVEFL